MGTRVHDSQQEQHYTICTGGEYEDPNYLGDTILYHYELGVLKHPFYGTLEQARNKGWDLAIDRASCNELTRKGIISVHYWIIDSQGNVFD